MRYKNRFNTKNIKISSIILAYAAVITLAFVLFVCVFYFSVANGAAKETAAGSMRIYALKQGEIYYAYPNGSALVNMKNATPMSNYNEDFLTFILSGIFPYAACFCLFLLLSAYLLWRILGSVQRKNDMEIVAQLNVLQDGGEYTTDNPALQRAYDTIRQKFEEHINDYKRLNSYLSHEQKNAIAILRTTLELNGETEHLDTLDFISDSIDDVLTLSENADSRNLSPVDVSLVCAAVCDNYAKVTDTISFDFDETENTEIYAKERWIYRAVANLVGNAVKYGAGNSILVTVRNRKSCVIVTVEDHGIGIKKAQQERIFGHRYRVNELNKDGYGIGLSLVSHVCDLCGGFACVESEEGKGSKFYLSFPQIADE